MDNQTRNPFIAGSWVRGEDFFGRQELIDEIVSGQRNYVWICGTRRFGKTSLLKQLELLTRDSPQAQQFIPLFWDMQGSQDVDGLKESLLEGIEDAEERFAEISVDIDELEQEELFGILRILRRKTKEAGLNLLLLCDEVEELINVEKNTPEALPKLRRFFQRGENVYTVLTATRRLSQLEHTSIPNTSPFLHGFVPPVYLPRLSREEALRLVRRWPFIAKEVEDVLERTDHHPYLMQLICKRLIELGELERVYDEVRHDDMISKFFDVDFQNLQEQEKGLLWHLLQQKAASLQGLEELSGLPRDALVQALYSLVSSGMVKQVNGDYRISNYFFESWLEKEKQRIFAVSELTHPEVTRTVAVPLESPDQLPSVGDRLAQHEILEKIGQGGMGVVFKARDVNLNRIVALKVLAPAYLSEPDFKERFLIEAQAASALNHPNICTIYQVDEINGLMFISMEYLDGETLRVWNDGSRSLVDKLSAAIAAGEGLAHAHSKKVIHRDVKPDNIMMTRESHVKMMDFGLAKMQHRAELHLTKTGTAMGTLPYMSPEQVSGTSVDHRSDLFSFGVVLYELFTDRLPFETGQDLKLIYSIFNEDPEPPTRLKPEIPEDLNRMILKALEKDKERRFQSMGEMLEVLRALRG